MKKHLFRTMLLSAMAMFLAFTSCKKDDDDDDVKPTPSEIILDGYYIKGAGTALTDFDDKGMMTVTRNEVNQEDRSALMEIYMAVKAGTDGFNIVSVAGSTQTTYGPAADFGVIANPTQDEPHDYAFMRGTMEATDNAFTVPEDGLYHIIIDTELMKVVVARVGAWGVIGGATLLGWGDDTELPAQGFDLETMNFKAENIQLSASNFKFRYSGGWKIELDTVLDLGNGNIGVKVNTNYGGTLNDLVPGGDNIDNTEPGIYTVEMTWTLGEGYTATLTKTGEVAVTDWTGVPLELVGTGVSADNTNAVPDPSSWNWGNVLTDDDGVPTYADGKYTWNWTNVTLVVNEGFKLRTVNGVAPANGNGANFDSGYGDLDATNSSATIVDNGGNLVSNSGGIYNITMVIDANASDAKTITITQVR